MMIKKYLVRQLGNQKTKLDTYFFLLYKITIHRYKINQSLKMGSNTSFLCVKRT